MKWNEKATEFSCQVESGILFFIREDNKICITGFDGFGGSLSVPEAIGGYPVCRIGKKAFLGNKSLCHIILPESLEWIGDWAFCNCMQLQKIEFPHRQLILGKGLFAKDEKLCEIIDRKTREENTFPARLLAAAVTLLEAEYLLDMTQAGTDKWYRQLDNRLLTMLTEPPESALKDLVYCAEEDMGAKQEACLEEQNRKKAYMALLRLAYRERLEKAAEEKLKGCLLNSEGLQTKAAWTIIKEAIGTQQLVFCDVILQIGGIREENLPAVLEDLGETKVELKAHLLKQWEQRKEQTSVWETLIL